MNILLKYIILYTIKYIKITVHLVQIVYIQVFNVQNMKTEKFSRHRLYIINDILKKGDTSFLEW